MTEFNITHDIHFVIFILKEILYLPIEPAKNTNNCSTCSNSYIHYNIVKICKGIFRHMQQAICNLTLRGTKHFIIKLRMNKGKINAFNHRTIESLSIV